MPINIPCKFYGQKYKKTSYETQINMHLRIRSHSITNKVRRVPHYLWIQGWNNIKGAAPSSHLFNSNGQIRYYNVFVNFNCNNNIVWAEKTIYGHPLLAVLIEVNTQNILDISQAQTLCRSTLGVIKRFQYVYKTTNRRVPRHVLL